MSRRSYGRPIVVTESGSSLLMMPVEMGGDKKKTGYDEQYIQELAFEHPECLPVSEIDPAYENLVPVCMELSTPVGPLDALYVTPTGRLVVVEAKLWRNPEARRKVIGQILDYAKELSAWDYEDLQREVSRKLGRKGNALYELVAEKYPDVDEAEFVDEVQSSLESGRFLLVILGDGIRSGAATIANYLETVGKLEFTFGLVELSIFEHPDIGRLVQPRVIAKTVEIGRHVVQLADKSMVLADSNVEEIVAKDDSARLNANQAENIEFWSEFIGRLQLDDPGQQVPNTTKSSNLYFPMPPSGDLCWVCSFIGRSKGHAGVYLTYARGSLADLAWPLLQEERVEIDKELGAEAHWGENNGLYRVTISRSFNNVASEQNRDEVYTYLEDNVNRFINVFRGRMKRIAREYSE